MDVLEKGLRFQGEAVWWLPRALPPSSQGRDPCSSGGRHTWLPAGEGQDRKASESSPEALRSTWGVSPPPSLPFGKIPNIGHLGSTGPL